MAAPAYTTDLFTITDAESVTGWAALGGGGAGIAPGPDLSMQGTNCIDKQITAAEKGMVYNNGATITQGTDTHFYVWIFLATPGLADTLQNRGLSVVAGTSTTAYVQFHVEGSDTYGAVGRVGKCYPIRYVTTSNTGAVPYRTLTGSPGANAQYFGAIAKTVASVKGTNLGVDAIRYGTGIYITAGDTSTPATFSGSSAANDTVNNRWGVLTYTSGTTYELQGRLVVGQISSSAHTPTQAYFSDTGKTIQFADTPHSLTNFSQFIVDHAQTTCSLNNVAFVGAGTNNPGRFVVNNATSSVILDGCTFDRIGATTLQPSVSASSCIWNNCAAVTHSAAYVDSCTFNKTRVLTSRPDRISSTSFTGTLNSSGSHGLEIKATGSYSFSGNAFSNFGATNSTSASLFNNSGGQVTMSIVDGGSTPTYYNSPGSSTLVENSVSLTMNLVDADGNTVTSSCEVTVVKNSDTSVLFEEENVISGTSQYLYNYTGDTLIYINVLNVSLYEPKTVSGTILTNTNQTVTIQLDAERGKYTNPG